MDKRGQKSESFAVAALLALAGGLLDAYTYLCRGGVFANAQTGNLVLLAVRAAEGQWRRAGTYLVPILAFLLGVLAAEAVKRHARPGRRSHWRHTVLAIEMGTLVLAACIPLGEWDGAVNSLVSFVCALQVEAFRTVQGLPFASTMCTGNLRSGTEALYVGVTERRGAELRKSGYYFGVIASFLAGAALGVFVSRFAPQRAVLAAAALQGAVFALLWEKKRENLTIMLEKPGAV